jgi:cathepsin B
MRVALFALLAIGAFAAPREHIADRVNRLGTTWTAKRNDRATLYPMGVKPDHMFYPLETKMHDVDRSSIPPTFDARSQWPACQPTIGNIRDQSECGSCWAVAAASVFSDRKCIASGGKVHTSFSGEDTLSCCNYMNSQGCNGGYPEGAWEWFVKVGVVSGGNFTSKAGCRPYLFCPPDVGHMCQTPECAHVCDGSMPANNYASDKHHAKSAYRIDGNVEQMQQEVVKSGSIEVSFAVYEDFFHYKSGVYQRTPGSKLAGYHAVRLIGWGTLNDVPYWLIANSWGSMWGMNGYFMIRRGVNECGIESGPVAGQVDGSP